MFRILVVDDEVAITEALAELLASDEISVDAASNGKQALERLLQAPYDLVLLDYMMPVKNGRDTLAEIRQSPALDGVKIVFMSAFSQAQLDFGGHPIDGFLRKPFDIDALFSVIETHRGRHDH